MILFYIKWLKKCFQISNESIVLRLTLNDSYKYETNKIEEYWSDLTGIPKSQFTKAFYQKVQWKRAYINDNYKGVLRIHVKKSLKLLSFIKGTIRGMKFEIT